MNRKIIVTTAVLIGVLTYQLGLFERPEFEFHESLVGREFFAIVATSTNKNIGQNVMRLLKGTLDGIESLSAGKTRLKAAADFYGAPEGAERLGFALYFDDPKMVDHPRWAIGWAVDADNFREVRSMAKEVKEASGLEEPVRAVRIGNDSVLKAKIPWHNYFTPAIAPMLQWPRGFDYYEKKGYTSKNGRKDEDGAVALEVYVTGANDSHQYLDYVILMGDTTHTWDDCFPTKDQLERQEALEDLQKQPTAWE